MNDIQNNELQPLIVSIQCFTYNHEKYIRDTLEGFVMQKTNFRFEAIVHDDASTDGTSEIIKEYAEKYPSIIKPIYETENQYSKKDGTLRRIMFDACKGRYIAFCEGDDYWTDPYKLQKQVDYLEANPECVLCSHRYREYLQSSETFTENVDLSHSGDVKGIKYDLNLLIRGGWLSHPLSCMYRRASYDISYLNKFKVVTDAVLFYVLLKKGYGYCMNDIMAVYRIHGKGIWSGLTMNEMRIFEYNLRLDIYRVDKSKEAAIYLLSQFTKTQSRIFLLKNARLLLTVSTILSKKLGLMYTIRVLFNKIVLGRNLKFDLKQYVTEVK